MSDLPAAQNHSWRFGWNAGISYSLENCSFNYIIKYQAFIHPNSTQSRQQLLFIDIDLLHGGLSFNDASVDIPDSIRLTILIGLK